MESFTFGITITIVGMGSTLFVLWFLTLMVSLLKRIFPYRESTDKEKEAKS